MVSVKLALVATVALAGASTSQATTATYHVYDGVQPDQTYCNIQWTSIDRITAYANVGTDLVCGDCVQITNTRTNAQLVVQVVDKGGNIFDLSEQAFNTLDTDGNGYLQGHLDITYQKVSCSGSSATSTPTATTAAPTTTTTSTGCGSCKGCLWTYSGGSQCFTNSVEAACDTYGSGYTWCA